jgi:hypothetical protein
MRRNMITAVALADLCVSGALFPLLALDVPQDVSPETYLGSPRYAALPLHAVTITALFFIFLRASRRENIYS